LSHAGHSVTSALDHGDAYTRAAAAPRTDTHADTDADTNAYADNGGNGGTNPYANTGADANASAAYPYADSDARATDTNADGHADTYSPASIGAGQLGKWRIFWRYGLAEPLGHDGGLRYPGKNPGRASWWLRAPAPAPEHGLGQPGREPIWPHRGAPPILGQGQRI